MQIIIDSEICKAHGISVDDYFVLYCLKHQLLTTDNLGDFIKDGNAVLLGNTMPFAIRNYRLTAKGEEVFNTVESKMTLSNAPTPKSRLLNLAEQMCAVFPAGKMPNTKYSWQGTPGVIAERLKSFIRKFGDFPDEQFIDAAKRYVADYAKQNYQYMQLLKYFIWKDDNIKGMDSQLLTYIVHPEMGTEETDIGNATLV